MKPTVSEGPTLHRLLARSFRLHGKLAFAELAADGLTPGQPRILHYLVQNDGCIQRAIAADNDLEPATVTSALDGLERSGYVRREAQTQDRRIQRVFLTDRGREAHQRAQQVFAALEDRCLAVFSPEERALLAGLLERLTDRLKDLEGALPG